MTTGQLEFTVHREFSDFDANEWNALLARSVTDTPFLRYEYQRNWWEHRGGGEWPEAELSLVAARGAEGLAGVAPLFRAVHDGRPALLLVGSIEISDYLDLIVPAASLAEFTAGLFAHLEGGGLGGRSALDWYNIPDASPTLRQLRDEADRRQWSYVEETYRPTPYIALPADFQRYLEGLDKKQRHEIRRKMRRLDERGGATRWYIVKGDNIDSEFEALFGMMAQDSGKASFLTPEMQAQMRGAMQAAHEAGWLWLAFLEIDGMKAAASLNFDYGGRLWGYNSAVNRDFLDASPGWVLLGHVLQWAIENGRTEFDFMRGGEAYKYRFGAVDRYVVRAQVSPA